MNQVLPLDAAVELSQLQPEHGKLVVAFAIHECRPMNFIRELKRRGFRVADFTATSPVATFSNLIAFVKAIRCSEFVFCGAPVPANIPWILLTRLLNRPCIVDCPMDITTWPFPVVRHWRWRIAFALKCANPVVTIRSRAYLIRKFGLNERRVMFIESCPDRSRIEDSVEATPHFRPRAGAFIICCSGCHPHHRLERFMPTFESLLALIPGAELLLIADLEQPSVVECKRYARAAGIGDRVHAIPIIKPVEEFYATVSQCSLWVATMGDDTLQGRHEFRMELLEIGLLGQPVITAPTPGLVDHGLVDRREILYMDPSDPRGSARKIADYASNPTLLTEIGRQLRERVRHEYSLQTAVDALLEGVSRKGVCTAGQIDASRGSHVAETSIERTGRRNA